MEPYILFALLLIGPVEPLPQHGREVAWSAEFTSLGSCNEAGLALGKKFNPARVGTSRQSRKSLQFAPLPSSSGESRLKT
jgi:hypothetical protein